jgi:glycosyltransferase involved in cell wall biosynthesis
MLIGIDASRASAAQRTGTENYSLHLIRWMLALDHAHRFRLYFNRPPSPDLFPAAADWRIIPFPRLWTHARLSWEMATQPPDVLFVPSHVLPLVHPERSVVTVHDLGYHYYPEAHTLFQNIYLRWSTRHNARVASRILADSEATRLDLIRHYRVAPKRIVVVYPGRDENLTRVTDRAALASVRARYNLSGRYVLYVGTLHPRKNLVRLVQAFASVVRSQSGPADEPDATDAGPGSGLSDLQLVLAGRKGWLFDDIVAQVRKLNLEGRVVLTGYVPAGDLPALMSDASAFAYPSLYEGFGLPVLEAMACGTPVVCANGSSLPEVAGDAALMVDPLDVDSIAKGLAAVVTDDGLCQELVRRGLVQMQRFSWHRCAQETLQVLEDAGRGLG